MVSSFKTVFDSQVVSLSDKPLSEQKAIPPNHWQKIKDSKDLRIQGEGNLIQFSFNEEIIDDLDNLFTATTIIYEIKEKLLKRNKLIRIAHDSPAVWRTVREYEKTTTPKIRMMTGKSGVRNRKPCA